MHASITYGLTISNVFLCVVLLYCRIINKFLWAIQCLYNNKVNQFTFKSCERLSEQCLLEEGLGFICHSQGLPCTPIVENLGARLMVSSVM